jgi:cytochrome c553
MLPSFRFSRISQLLLPACFTVTLLWGGSGVVTAASTVEFNRDILPILTDQCLSCHGPDGNSRQADLRLDRRDNAIELGAIVPGKADESELVKRIVSVDPDEIMPPPESHKKLDDRQRKLIRDWIDAGAEYQPHWAFIPPVKPAIPDVEQAGWSKNPIDSFILASLQSNGLSPNAEADLRTLIRRVSLDLTGLPPTPEEIESVLSDPRPGKYERYVDELLTRPTWGEHRARYWMDYARYGDTHGIHLDNYREMYSYRDWVIEAFNENLPFDRFTVEQLAGDLLPNSTLDQQIASGFNRCNITTNEGGIIDEEYAVLYARDRVETTSTVWLALTTGCAVCHDHKFDPISQKEFYQLSAFFNNTTQKVRDGNVRDTPPIIRVPLPQDERRYSELLSEIRKVNSASEDRRKKAKPDFDKWLGSYSRVRAALENSTVKLPEPTIHLPLTDDLSGSLGAVIDGRWIRLPLEKPISGPVGQVGGKSWKISDVAPSITREVRRTSQSPFSVSLWLHLNGDRNSGLVVGSLDDKPARGWQISLSNNKVVVQVLGANGKELIKLTSEKQLPKHQWHHLSFSYDGSGKAAGMSVFSGESVLEMKVNDDTLKSVVEFSGGIRFGSVDKNPVEGGVLLQEVRVFDEQRTPEDFKAIGLHDRIAWLLSKNKRSEQENSQVEDWYFQTLDQEYGRISKQLIELENERASIETKGTIAHVMAERPEKPVAHILMRGEYDKRGDEVSPDTPSALPPMPDSLPRNRLGLAQWLVMKEHPLTARVTVNRFWQEVFGQGLVPSTGDFGLSGAQPTNQPLLDFLSVEFQENDWNVKELFRLMVTSSTYRQSSQVSADKLSVDATNALLSRGPRFRMDGEMIRDYALYVSGLMSRKIGGKSVRPYQPIGVWEAVAMTASDTRFYKEDEGESLYRRSLYTFWKRAAPPPSLEIFNAPTREVCTVKRERTNTPLQALVTLNDPQFIEAARQLAERAMSLKIPSTSEQIQWLSSVVLSRQLLDAERDIVEEGRERLEEFYRSNPDEAKLLLSIGKSPRNEDLDPIQHAVWTMVAHQLLNLDEALCK